MRFEYRLVAFSAFAAIGIVAWGNYAGGQSKNNDVASLVESIRQKHRVPALGVAIVTSRGVVVSAVTGTRKAGTDVAATIDDQWHLGSDTKAMTAVIIATFVERGKITWETTLGEVFTELTSGFPLEFRAITVTQLLSHYAGLPANLAWRQIAGLALLCRNSAWKRSK
jgi:CubicO group peptidase (beta-lactamase class C family)